MGRSRAQAAHHYWGGQEENIDAVQAKLEELLAEEERQNPGVDLEVLRLKLLSSARRELFFELPAEKQDAIRQEAFEKTGAGSIDLYVSRHFYWMNSDLFYSTHCHITAVIMLGNLVQHLVEKTGIHCTFQCAIDTPAGPRVVSCVLEHLSLSPHLPIT